MRSAYNVGSGWTTSASRIAFADEGLDGLVSMATRSTPGTAAKLLTIPLPTGSPTAPSTMGINSAACSATRSYRPAASRYSMTMLWPAEFSFCNQLHGASYRHAQHPRACCTGGHLTEP